MTIAILSETDFVIDNISFHGGMTILSDKMFQTEEFVFGVIGFPDEGEIIINAFVNGVSYRPSDEALADDTVVVWYKDGVAGTLRCDANDVPLAVPHLGSTCTVFGSGFDAFVSTAHFRNYLRGSEEDLLLPYFRDAWYGVGTEESGALELYSAAAKARSSSLPIEPSEFAELLTMTFVPFEGVGAGE